MAPETILPLTLTPYGVSVFSDLERRKSFATLFFRLDKTSREQAFLFPGVVLDALTRSRIATEGGLKVRLTPTLELRKFRVHVEVNIFPVSASEDDFILWVKDLASAAHFGKAAKP